jgi:hypothetical protein
MEYVGHLGQQASGDRAPDLAGIVAVGTGEDIEGYEAGAQVWDIGRARMSGHRPDAAMPTHRRRPNRARRRRGTADAEARFLRTG